MKEQNSSSRPQTNHTRSEIEGQPVLWKEVYELLKHKHNELTAFLAPLFSRPELQVILTGAGSSAFIGEAAQGIFQRNSGINARAIATTDLVTHPGDFFRNDRPTLLISFARSGNSPESLESVKLAEEFCSESYHIFITCNKEGELIKYADANTGNSLAILLPEACNDKSLAMTGSFTCMLLTTLLLSDLKNLPHRQAEIDQIAKQAEFILENYLQIRKVSDLDFDRVVFLGSGPMLGIARECHLKLQELTDGQIICKFDSFLGFRHGPRAVVNEKTLLVYLFSADDHVYLYERDLAASVAKDSRNIKSLSVGREEEEDLKVFLNLDLNFSPQQELNIIPATLIGQMLGYYKSLERDLNPDNPSVSGSISRVVQGVTIYPHPKPLVK